MASIYHLLNRQIPAHIREQYPVFCKFIEYYYRWLQTRGFDKLEKVTNIDYECQAVALKDCLSKQVDQNGEQIPVDADQFAAKFVGYTVINDQGVVAEIVGCDGDKAIIRYLTVDGRFNLNDQLFIRQNTSFTVNKNVKYDTASVSQVQTLPSAYIDHFANLLDSDHIFDTTNANIALILKHIKHLYQSKGSEQALTYILKATKNIDAEIRHPWNQVLKPSDGRWRRQFAVNVKIDEEYRYLDLSIFSNLDTIRLEIPSDDPDDPESTKVDKRIVKVEVFGSQQESYDNPDWWKRSDYPEDPEHEDYVEGYYSEDGSLDYSKVQYDKYGRIMFQSKLNPHGYPRTYGKFGDGRITPFIRLYFEDNPEVFVGQKVQVVHKTADGQYNERVDLQGVVTLGVKGFDIVKPGKMWQVGQIFTTNKDKLWQIYKEPNPQLDEEGHIIPNVIKTNERGVMIQYSTDVPLIGRVTAVGPQGEIQGVEIVQLGDHLPSNASKRIAVSPLFNDTIDSTPYQAELDLVYGVQTNVMGYFEDNRGMISDNDIRLQDNLYYQKFSYDIVANADPNTYMAIAEKMHPAGTKMFTTYVLEASLDNAVESDFISSSIDLTVSLFDVAHVMDVLVKKITKRLQDISQTVDKVTITTIKRLWDETLINDMSQDRIYMTERSFGYDESVDPYFERDFADNGANLSYCEVGYIKRLYINYEYHTISKQYQVPGGGSH